MTIVAIEGASAVGKSTVCRILEAEFGFTRIPEVNELYSRGRDSSSNWYFERQIDRWRLAGEVSSTGGSAVLDGDPFQPVWYNWIFPDCGVQPMAEVIGFYREKVNAGVIGCPDKYYVLTSTESELRQRKAADQRRSRRNFEKHLRLIQPQLAYFAAINNSAPGLVSVVASIDSREIANVIASDSPDLRHDKKFNTDVFEIMCRVVGEEYESTT